MKKIKKIFLYLLGLILVFMFKITGVFATQHQDLDLYRMAQTAYGVGPIKEATLWERVLSVVLSPIFIAIIIVLAFIIGVIIIIKRKKNAKKNS